MSSLSVTKIEFGLRSHANLQLTRGTLIHQNWLYEMCNSPRGLHMDRQCLRTGSRCVMVSGFMEAEIAVADDTPKADDKSSDWDDNLMRSRLFGNSRSWQSHYVTVSVRHRGKLFSPFFFFFWPRKTDPSSTINSTAFDVFLFVFLNWAAAALCNFCWLCARDCSHECLV